MQKNLTKDSGLKMLLKKYKEIFRIPENINYYSEENYQLAEKKFIKHALIEGKI